MNCAPAIPQTGAMTALSFARALWHRVSRLSQRPTRRLRLSETLSLGERRFVAVIEFEQSRFLVGGTASSIVLLTRLTKTAEGDAAENTDSAERFEQELP